MVARLEDLSVRVHISALVQAARVSDVAIREMLVKLPSLLIDQIRVELDSNCLDPLTAFDIDWIARSIKDQRNCSFPQIDRNLDGLCFRTIVRACGHLTVEEICDYLSDMTNAQLHQLRLYFPRGVWVQTIRTVLRTR